MHAPNHRLSTLLLACALACAGCGSSNKADPICTPDEKRCSGDDVEKCRSDGTDWTFYRACDPQSGETCRNGTCEVIPQSCNNGSCEPAKGETCNNCPEDCGACCGNGACEPQYNETNGTCPADCGQAADGSIADSSGDDDSGVTPGCQAGTKKCSQDGFGVHYCGFDGVTNSFGMRIPCDSSDKCVSGGCTDSACNAPEVIIVLDRSSSMLKDNRWQWVSSSVSSLIKAKEGTVYFGFRTFPSGSGCSASTVVPPALNNSSKITSYLAAPTTTASTPLGKALGGLSTYYGDPDISQAAILITDGDETCDTPQDVVKSASLLFHKGVRVYTIGITTQANSGLLNQIAAVGGTKQSYTANSGAALDTALASVLTDLKTCSAPSCADIFACGKQCTDANCVWACLGKGCQSAQSLAQALYLCGLQSCPADCQMNITPQCESCVKASCPSQYSACLSNSC